MSVYIAKRSIVPRPELIIFDCDGVLVDSEVLSMAILGDLIAASGIEMQPETVQALFQGRSLASTVKDLQASHQVDISEKDLADMNTRLFASFKAALEPIPGVRQFINRLTLPFCVASSSTPDRIRYSLKLTGLLDDFGERIFSSTMVKVGKPAPDLFLYAAKNMGVKPRNCVVIEDSAAGLQAAQRASMIGIGLTAGMHAKGVGYSDRLKKHGASVVCTDYDEISQFLGQLT
jgi:HAD superfamily hydrolase (TIGR01509 family)